MSSKEAFLCTAWYNLLKTREAIWPHGESLGNGAYWGQRPGGIQMKHLVRIGQAVIGIVGMLGTLTCVGAIVLAAIGIAGGGASAGMTAMGAMTSSGHAIGGQSLDILALLLRTGPLILLVSIAAITLSLALRRWVTAIPALLAGGIIYWGMYGQPNLSVMYITIGVGLSSWAAVFLWVRSFPQTGK